MKDYNGKFFENEKDRENVNLETYKHFVLRFLKENNLLYQANYFSITKPFYKPMTINSIIELCHSYHVCEDFIDVCFHYSAHYNFFSKDDLKYLSQKFKDKYKSLIKKATEIEPPVATVNKYCEEFFGNSIMEFYHTPDYNYYVLEYYK